MRPHHSVPCLILLGAALLCGADSLNGCLDVKVGPVSAATSGDVSLTLTNNCGKSITAYALEIRDQLGVRISGLDTDLLVRLVNTDLKPENDILREGRTQSIQVAASMVPPLATVVATAALFSDHSAAGEPEAVKRMRGQRQLYLTRLEGELDTLRAVADYAEAHAVLHEKARLARTGVGDAFSSRLLTELEERLNRSDATSWKVFTDEKRQWYLKVIKLYRDHLQQGEVAPPEK